MVQSTSPDTSRVFNILAWVLQIVLAAGFLGAGIAKFVGVETIVQDFETIGLGQGFRYLTGTFEIAGAIGLLFPRYAGLAALWLSVIMVGATAAHLLILPPPLFPALILLVLCLVVAWLRRGRTIALLSKA